MAFAGKSAADAVRASQGNMINGKKNQIPTTVVDGQGRDLESQDATVDAKVDGINLAISIGTSTSESKEVPTRNATRGAVVAAGHDLNVLRRAVQVEIVISRSEARACRQSTDWCSMRRMKSGCWLPKILLRSTAPTAHRAAAPASASGRTACCWPRAPVVPVEMPMAVMPPGPTRTWTRAIKRP